MKREYKIVKSDLWYNVYRQKEENWIKMIEWLQKDSYTLNRWFARTFYHLNDATSALVISKARWEKETSTISTEKSECEERKEKTSWSEL